MKYVFNIHYSEFMLCIVELAHPKYYKIILPELCNFTSGLKHNVIEKKVQKLKRENIKNSMMTTTNLPFIIVL